MTSKPTTRPVPATTKLTAAIVDKPARPAGALATRPTNGPSTAIPSALQKPKPTVAPTPKFDATNSALYSTQLQNKSKARITVPATPAPTVPTSAGASKVAPTPATAPAVRSYSEIVRSEEALQQHVLTLNTELKEMKSKLSEKDFELSEMTLAIERTKIDAEGHINEWQRKLDEANSQEQERFQRIAVNHATAQERIEALETKLGELGIDPETMEPADIPEEELEDIRRAKELFKRELEALSAKTAKRVADFQAVADEIDDLLQQVDVLEAPSDLPDFVLEALTQRRDSIMFDENTTPDADAD